MPERQCVDNLLPNAKGCQPNAFSEARRERLRRHFVHLAPSPILARLEGLHDRVTGFMNVCRRVRVRR